MSGERRGFFTDRTVYQNTLHSDLYKGDSLALFLLASGDPRIDDLLVKSPDTADTNCRDFTFLG